MPDAPNTIYLCPPQDIPDVKVPVCLPGRVSVLMYSGESRNGILMPGSGRLNPDVGRVLSPGTRWLKPGDEVLVKVIDIDPQGRVRLSRKAALKETKENAGGNG